MTGADEWVLEDGDIPFYRRENSALVYRGRNYELFAALSGIRGHHRQLIPSRGLPSDVSPIVAACANVESDCVGHSFALLEELRSIEETDCSDAVFTSVLEEMARIAAKGAVRAVYWFDP